MYCLGFFFLQRLLWNSNTKFTYTKLKRHFPFKGLKNMSYVTLYTEAIEIKHTKCQLRSRIIFSHFNSTIRFNSVYFIDSYFLLNHYCIIFSLKSAVKLYWCVYTSNKKPVFEYHKLIKYRREWSSMSLMINLITPDRIW